MDRRTHTTIGVLFNIMHFLKRKRENLVYLNNSIEHKPREANNHSTSQILRLFWNQKFHYCFHNRSLKPIQRIPNRISCLVTVKCLGINNRRRVHVNPASLADTLKKET
jgi:hypothetical protein